MTSSPARTDALVLARLEEAAARVAGWEKEAALALSPAGGQDTYRRLMREKALFLAGLPEVFAPLLAGASMEISAPAAAALERFAQGAAQALSLDSVFYMSALLYPEDHVAGEPNNLERLILDLQTAHTVYHQILHSLYQGKEAFLVTRCCTGKMDKTAYAGSLPPEIAQNGRLTRDENMMTLVERFLPKTRLIIFGCGHIAVPLAKIAAMLQFDVTVFDDRPSFANAQRFPEAREIICDYFDNAPRRLTIRDGDYVAIVTRGHRHDLECLRQVLQGKFPYYVGMIGSRRRVAIVRRQMLEEGFAPERVDRLHAPVGLPLGAVTPEEIALSIAAEIIREKRLGLGDTPEKSLWTRAAHADMELLEWLAGGEKEQAALITVLSTKGSTPREAGAKMAICLDGRSIGSIGGGCAEAGVIGEARNVIRHGGYCVKTIDLTNSAEEDGMMCGGVMEVLIEAVPDG
ncbi:MAG: XdhC family protein [Desulfovibrio sp.]|jgi:xanthine dehydrogenase accessory factor|nr:XdhC family protein [Desulfovibrio sp.]